MIKLQLVPDCGKLIVGPEWAGAAQSDALERRISPKGEDTTDCRPQRCRAIIGDTIINYGVIYQIGS